MTEYFLAGAAIFIILGFVTALSLWLQVNSARAELEDAYKQIEVLKDIIEAIQGEPLEVSEGEKSQEVKRGGFGASSNFHRKSRRRIDLEDDDDGSA
jgi:hypothetical protein